MNRKETEAYRDAETRRRLLALQYGDDVRRQIREKEDRSILEKDERLREATLAREADADRDEKILEIKAKKLQELRRVFECATLSCQLCCRLVLSFRSEEIPNKYVMDIARKSRVPWTIRSSSIVSVILREAFWRSMTTFVG